MAVEIFGFGVLGFRVGVYGDLIKIYPRPYSSYLRGPRSFVASGFRFEGFRVRGLEVAG